MKILLTGCTGQVGWELVRSLMPLGEVIAADRSQADLARLDDLRNFVRRVDADVIVNAGAYTAVDRAEEQEELATRINGQAPAILAEEAARRGALLIHYSTDYVFDGTKREAYTERDIPNPVNAYGRSKLMGEKAIQAAGADYLILRTSWVYAARGQNFLRTVMRLAGEQEELNIVADQLGAPTWARLIAETTSHVLRQSQFERSIDRFTSDTFHRTAGGETSWQGFACAIVDAVRRQNESALKVVRIKPTRTVDYPAPARRPLNSRLSTARLSKRFGLEMPSWKHALELCLGGLA